MEYTIRELADLSGVTTRTLRWYDQIGLLKPSRVAESGYRYYGGEEVDRLQDILYYRALGVELARIKECLDDPSFDRLAALRNHLAALEAERERLEQLIRSVKDTIGAEERNEIMSDEQKFEAFKQRAVAHNEEVYGAEIRAKYGDQEVDEANAAVMNLTREQYQEWTDLGREIQERLEAAVLFGIQYQVHLAVSYSEAIARINSAPIKKSQSFRLDDLITAKERELAKITRYKQSLYQDWKDGEITQQDYRNMKADYERQAAALSDVLERLTTERAELANGVDNEHPALVAFMKYQNIETLNREILIELVDHIKVYENGNIKIKFKFADELRKIAEYIEINTSEIPAVAG